MTQFSQKHIPSGQKPGPEVERLIAALIEDERQKKENGAEVERIEGEVKSLGMEVTSKVCVCVCVCVHMWYCIGGWCVCLTVLTCLTSGQHFISFCLANAFKGVISLWKPYY